MSVNGGFFRHIQDTYGRDTVRLLKLWINIEKKIASLKNRRIFLLQCRSKKLCPSHISNNMKCLYSLKAENHPYLKQIENIVNRFEKSVINIEIKITIWKLRNFENELKQTKNTVSDLLPMEILNNFSSSCQKIFDKTFSLIKQSNLKKIIRLSNKVASFELETHDKFLYNFTDVVLPLEVNKTLCAGPKFAIPLCADELPIPNIIKDLEYCIQALSIQDDDQNIIRASCVNNITNYMLRSKNVNTNYLNPIVRDFRVCRSFLKSHPELVVMRSDKGNSTVVMLREDYINGMGALLADSLTYKVLPSDPTTKYQNMANNLCKKMFSLGYIEESNLKKLKCTNSVFPKLYGLRKTHKPSLSLRPVVSCINSPSYNLAVFVHQILAQVTTTFRFNIRNSFEFVKFAQDILLPDNCILVSLDVTSLFTNIPKELVLHIITKKWGFISAYTELSRTSFCELVGFLFSSSYFVFNDTFYQQLDGSAMGNPASPVLANLVMNELITEVVATLPFKLPFIKLYVDDTICACPGDKVDELLKMFNSYHHKLKFTIELEKDNKLPFLDVLVIRNPNGTLETNWYLKPTASGRVVNYLSAHALTHKISTVKNLFYRAYHLSSAKYHKENENLIKCILKTNNYPIALVNRILNGYNKQLQRSINVRGVSEPTRYFKFPYIEGLSEEIQKHISKKDPTVKLAFYNTKVVNSIFTRLKHPTPKLMLSNLIYRVPCAGCSKCYVGQTRQYLKKRLYQHEYDCRLINYNKEEKTALASHHFATSHNFDFSEVQILDREGQYFKRNVSEMIYITLNDTVNCRADTMGLSVQYNRVIDLFKGD